MNTVKQVMAELKTKGNEQTLAIVQRLGAPSNTFGVRAADLKVIAKSIKGNQELAYKLYETGNGDAMYLAGLVADGSQMSKKQLQSWVKAADWIWLSEYTVAWVAAESPHARDLALKWMDSKRESIATSGWSTYTGIVANRPDEDLDLAEIKELLDRVVKEIDLAPNRVRYTMNGFVIAVGVIRQTFIETRKGSSKNNRHRFGRHGRHRVQSSEC